MACGDGVKKWLGFMESRSNSFREIGRQKTSLDLLKFNLCLVCSYYADLVHNVFYKNKVCKFAFYRFFIVVISFHTK